MIRALFFVLFGFHKGALNQKGLKGTTREPRGLGFRSKGL